jgi:imidazolonepropionase-like amidohydrolase
MLKSWVPLSSVEAKLGFSHMKKIFCLILLSCAVAAAQNVAVRAGHLINPADGSVSQNQTILVEGGKITAIGANVPIPAGTQTVDLSNEWVMPGLVDAHTHITMNLPPAAAGESYWENYLLRESTAFRTTRGLHNAELLLNAGFTAIRDVGNAGDYADTAVREALEKGWFAGPTLINSGKIIGPFGGQSHSYSPEQGRFWAYEYIDADNPAEIRKAVRQNIYYGAKVIKLVADNSSFHYSEEDIHAAVDEAHRAGLAVAVHVTSDQAARDVINGGADSVEHGYYLTPEVLKLMKAKGTYLVGTDFPLEHMLAFGSIADMNAQKTADSIIQRLSNAEKIGVKMAFGSDVVAELPGENRANMIFDFLRVWKKAGVPNTDILKDWTLNGFDLLRISDQRGPIAVGKAADMIAIPGNPLDNIELLRKVNFVMKDGRVIRRP